MNTKENPKRFNWASDEKREDEEIEQPAQKPTDGISGYNVRGVTTNCYRPEELQSLTGDTDDEQVFDEQLPDNGRGEVSESQDDSRFDDPEEEEVFDEQALQRHNESGVSYEPNPVAVDQNSEVPLRKAHATRSKKAQRGAKADSGVSDFPQPVVETSSPAPSSSRGSPRKNYRTRSKPKKAQQSSEPTGSNPIFSPAQESLMSPNNGTSIDGTHELSHIKMVTNISDKLSETSLYVLENTNSMHDEQLIKRSISVKALNLAQSTLKADLTIKIYRLKQRENDYSDVESENLLLFHGTGVNNAVGILEKGFSPSTKGLCGPGVYLTASSLLGMRYSTRKIHLTNDETDIVLLVNEVKQSHKLEVIQTENKTFVYVLIFSSLVAFAMLVFGLFFNSELKDTVVLAVYFFLCYQLLTLKKIKFSRFIMVKEEDANHEVGYETDSFGRKLKVLNENASDYSNHYTSHESLVIPRYLIHFYSCECDPNNKSQAKINRTSSKPKKAQQSSEPTGSNPIFSPAQESLMSPNNGTSIDGTHDLSHVSQSQPNARQRLERLRSTLPDDDLCSPDEDEEIEQPAQQPTDGISGYNVRGVTTNCYRPEELQSLMGDTDDEQVFDEQLPDNGRGEVSESQDDSRFDDPEEEEVFDEQALQRHNESGVSYEPNPVAVDQNSAVPLMKAHATRSKKAQQVRGVTTNCYRPEELQNLTGNTDDEQVFDEQLPDNGRGEVNESQDDSRFDDPEEKEVFDEPPLQRHNASGVSYEPNPVAVDQNSAVPLMKAHATRSKKAQQVRGVTTNCYRPEELQNLTGNTDDEQVFDEQLPDNGRGEVNESQDDSRFDDPEEKEVFDEPPLQRHNESGVSYERNPVAVDQNSAVPLMKAHATRSKKAQQVRGVTTNCYRPEELQNLTGNTDDEQVFDEQLPDNGRGEVNESQDDSRFDDPEEKEVFDEPPLQRHNASGVSYERNPVAVDQNSAVPLMKAHATRSKKAQQVRGVTTNCYRPEELQNLTGNTDDEQVFDEQLPDNGRGEVNESQDDSRFDDPEEEEVFDEPPLQRHNASGVSYERNPVDADQVINNRRQTDDRELQTENSYDRSLLQCVSVSKGSEIERMEVEYMMESVLGGDNFNKEYLRKLYDV